MMIRRACLVLCSVFLASEVIADKEAQKLPDRIIDMHAHIWNEPSDTDMSTFRDVLDKYNVGRIMVSGSVPLVSRLKSEMPERVIGGAIFTESEDLPSLEALANLYEDGVVTALGEIDAQYAGLGLSDRRFTPYWKFAADRRMIVSVHTGFAQPYSPYIPELGGFRARLGQPLEFDDALAQNYFMTPFLAHGGWPYLDQTKALLQLYPQLYVDIASLGLNPGIPTSEFEDYLKRLIVAGHGNRIMFGSGLSPDDYADDIKTVIHQILSMSFLTQEQKDDIFYGNAARFIGLEPGYETRWRQPRSAED